MSLKKNLNQIIKDRNGELFTITELEAYCKKAGYKLSNAERRLRPSESPEIERVFKKGYIIGYAYNQVSEKRIEQSDPPDSGTPRQSLFEMQPTTISGFAHISKRDV